jgi:hypothetical protein
VLQVSALCDQLAPRRASGGVSLPRSSLLPSFPPFLYPFLPPSPSSIHSSIAPRLAAHTSRPSTLRGMHPDHIVDLHRPHSPPSAALRSPTLCHFPTRRSFSRSSHKVINTSNQGSMMLSLPSSWLLAERSAPCWSPWVLEFYRTKSSVHAHINASGAAAATAAAATQAVAWLRNLSRPRFQPPRFLHARPPLREQTTQ